MSIRFKIIFPYLLLTLLISVTGAYVVTRLVANSLEERLTNQLLESGRVVSDLIARQDNKHVEAAHVIAFTQGVGEALQNEDAAIVSSLVEPITGALSVENVMIFDQQGREKFHAIKQANSLPADDTRLDQPATLFIVTDLLAENDPNSLAKRVLETDPIDGQYYYFTALPIVLNEKLVGAVVVGTSVSTIMPLLKSTSLADVILYNKDGQEIGSTLQPQDGGNAAFLREISMSVATYQKVLGTEGFFAGENISLGEHSYNIARSKLQVENELFGVVAVALPRDYVIETNAANRSSYAFLYSVAMLSVILIGYFIARLIINPISSLVRTSRAIAEGDLTKRSGIRSRDEIGLLSDNFDLMVENLQIRTIELEKTNQILEHMDRTRSRFVTVAGHELRVPLTLNKGYLQMLENIVKDNVEANKIVQVLLETSDRMNEIVDNLLDVSLIDNNALTLNETKMQIDMVMQKARKVFEEVFVERNIQFNVNGLNTLPVILADPELIRKALQNIISNAIKFTPDGGSIYVTGHIVNDNNAAAELEISIRDTGIGIDQDYQELIFEKFYQTDDIITQSSDKTKFMSGGPGLGLAIVRGIVNAHHGRVWVESPGHDEEKFPGSTIYIRLPLTT